jgi:hypothetical protein
VEARGNQTKTKQNKRTKVMEVKWELLGRSNGKKKGGKKGNKKE